MLCSDCDGDHLCALHFEGLFACLSGVAALRGEVWAERVAARCARSQPWPRTEKAHAIALTKVADLARDTRLIERLASHAERWAERWWSRAS